MGFGKWLARKGSIGSTAKTVALFYNKSISTCPELSTLDIKADFIDFRYSKVTQNPFAHVAVSKFSELMPGLSGLVVSVLSHEAGYLNNSPENRQLFMEIIIEELEKNGVPDNVIFTDSDSARVAA